MAILSYILIFISYIYSFLSIIAPSLFSYKQVALVAAILFFIVILKQVLKKNFTIKRSQFNSIIISLVICVLYNCTLLFYRGAGQEGLLSYYSFRLVVWGQTLPTIVLASFVAADNNSQMTMKRIAPIVGAILTVVSLYGTINPTSITSGGFIDSDIGLNYQSNSYCAAYGSAMIEYYLLTRNTGVHYKLLEKTCFVPIAWILIVIDAFSILSSGGRGGLVSYLFFAVMTLFFLLRKKSDGGMKVIRILIIILMFFIGINFVVRKIELGGGDVAGFQRIQLFIKNRSDSVRSELRHNAISSFMGSPVFGNGLGSIFLQWVDYSHNFFTDLLSETGIIGALIFAAFLLKTVHMGVRRFSIDYSECLWTYIFCCGFIMSLFSGYYLAQFPIWWIISFFANSESIINRQEE